jgi:peptide/nickel transport system ATP-binding protein
VLSGAVEVGGHDVLHASAKALTRIRGSHVSYVPQDPGGSLNPSRRAGPGIREVLVAHGRSGTDSHSIEAALGRVHLPTDAAFQRRFPHQLSGGQQQRVAIAMATALEPGVVVFDEPTTGLDVVTQARVIDEVRRLLADSAVAAVYVSHDLAVVAGIADRVAVMYAGRIVESGPTRRVLHSPSHPYTASLMACTPDHRRPARLRPIRGVPPGLADRSTGCAFRPRCDLAVAACDQQPPLQALAGHSDHDVACFAAASVRLVQREARTAAGTGTGAPVLAVDSLDAGHRTRNGAVVAARDVSLVLRAGECVALVGESGSGKTTIGRCVVGLHVPWGGTITLGTHVLAPHLRRRSREDRRRIQLVFQNPYESLNPRQSVLAQITRAAVALRGLSTAEASAEARAFLQRVRLPTAVAARYPGQLSGGERQRVAIARALIAKPEVLVCDEVTSALDVSVQAAVLELLSELRREMGLGLLFITHDLGVVASVADRVQVLERGVIRESGAVDQVLSAPADAYTRQLLEAAPALPWERGSELAPSGATRTGGSSPRSRVPDPGQG